MKRNFIYSTCSQMLSVITPLITAPYLARVLGPDGVGIQSFTTSVQAYFLLFAALGTTVYGAREISQHRDSKEEYSRLFWEIEGITVFTTLICLAAWALLVVFGGEYRIYYMALIPNLIAVMFDISWFFNGLEEFKRTVIRNMFFKLLGIVLMFVFVKEKEDLVLYILILSICMLASNMSLWIDLREFLERVNMRDLKFGKHMKQSAVYFVPTIATSIYTTLDRTLIGVITNSNEQNGYYEQACKVIHLAKSVSFMAINSVMSVRMAYLFKENRTDEIKIRIHDSMEFIMFMGVGCTCGIVGIAKNFVPFFFGDGYEPVIRLLYILSPIVLIIGVSNCLGAQYYTPSGRRAQSAKYIIAGAGVNLCLNLILIPFFRAEGAAVASIVAELVITILYVHYSNRYMTVVKWLEIFWKKLLCGVVMCVCVRGIGLLPVEALLLLLGLQILGGIVIYLVFLLLVRDPWCVKQVKTLLKKVG